MMKIFYRNSTHHHTPQPKTTQWRPVQSNKQLSNKLLCFFSSLFHPTCLDNNDNNMGGEVMMVDKWVTA